MGIFNIQSLRDKYLSDSGVPAGQDNRESPSADTASGRRRAGGSSRSSLQDGVARLSARHDLPQRSVGHRTFHKKYAHSQPKRGKRERTNPAPRVCITLGR